MPRTHHLRDEAQASYLPTATLRLRFGRLRLGGRVYWSGAIAAGVRSPLTFVPTVFDRRDAGALCRLLCSIAPTTVLTVPIPRDADHDYGLAALGWVVEHAAELQAYPEQLVVAGEGVGGALAAQLAVRVRDNGWPRLRRQVLLYPTFTEMSSLPSQLADVAPATVISSEFDEGSAYAALLRASDVEVDELRYPLPIFPGRDDLSAALAGRN